VKVVQQLQQRLDSLPLEIRTARIVELQRQIDALERRKTEAGSRLPDLKAAMQQAFERLQTAQREHLTAQQAYVRTQNELHSLALQVGQLRVRLDQVLAEGVATGPVVRSGWQAPPY
jgi:chromosome segregation ATPase